MEYIILLVSLAGIVFGADYLVSGAVSIARRFKVSDFVIGAAIVGVGTSMPELVVSFIGALKGNADVAIGNVVGSNIFNILGILGLTAVFFPIAVSKENMRFELPVCVAVSVLLTMLVFTGSQATISRFDGLVLLLCFVAFMWYSFHRDRKSAAQTESEYNHEEIPPLWKSILTLVLKASSANSFASSDTEIPPEIINMRMRMELTLIPARRAAVVLPPIAYTARPNDV